MKQNSIQLVAIDVDRTLLNSQHQMTERVEAAINACLAIGVPVVIATGKTRFSSVPLIERLKLDTPGVYSQGLVIHNADGSILYRHSMEPEQVARVVAFAQARDMPFLVYSGDRLLVLERSPYTDAIAKYHEPVPVLVPSFDGVPVEKFILMHEVETIPPLRRDLESTFGGQLTIVQALDDMVEIMPLGTSKGDGLRRLLDDMGVAPERVMAIGDGENDIEMLQLAGLGVAVGNAKPALKAVADVVVADNDHDGVAEAIERFVVNS
jgi:Cof subfamily protein (haloacid dehalogenase superfamily)